MAVTAEVLGVISPAWECSRVRGLQGQHQVHKIQKGSQFLSVSGLLPFTSCLKKDSTGPCLCICLPWQFLLSKMIFSRIVCTFLADRSKKEGKMCVLTSIFKIWLWHLKEKLTTSCKCWHYLCAFNDNKNTSFYNRWRKLSSCSASVNMKACFLFFFFESFILQSSREKCQREFDTSYLWNHHEGKTWFCLAWYWNLQ